MASEANAIPDDLEQLTAPIRRVSSCAIGTFTIPGDVMARGCRDGQALWCEPDSTGVAVGVRGPAKARRESGSAQSEAQKTEPADFLEFLAPGAKPVTNCSVEVESARGGKLRLELKSIATTELLDLIRAFVSQ
jgi:hypothetical protein